MAFVRDPRSQRWKARPSRRAAGFVTGVPRLTARPCARRFRRLLSILPAAAMLLLALGTIAVRTRAESPPGRPPGAVTAADTRNDAGRSITVTWAASPDEMPGAPPAAQLTGYRIFRAPSAEGPWIEAGHVPRGLARFIDAEGLTDGAPFGYRVVAEGEAPVAADDVASAPGASPPAGPAVSSAQWFHTGRVNMLIAVLTLSGLVLWFIRKASRGDPIFIRKIAGLEAVDEAVGRATEMGRKILFVPGTQDMDQVQTLAGIAILGRVARLTAEYETSLSVPVSRSLVMVACRETVREAYLATGRPDGYSDDMVYYLTDDQFGYAAALEGIMVREKPATIFMQGSFFAESLILAETGNSIQAIQIAGTAQASQLPFFVAACDYTLIGEELFVAGAYLSKEPRQLGSLKGQDIGKAILLVLMLVGIVAQTTGLVDFARIFRVE